MTHTIYGEKNKKIQTHNTPTTLVTNYRFFFLIVKHQSIIENDPNQISFSPTV